MPHLNVPFQLIYIINYYNDSFCSTINKYNKIIYNLDNQNNYYNDCCDKNMKKAIGYYIPLDKCQNYTKIDCSFYEKSNENKYTFIGILIFIVFFFIVLFWSICISSYYLNKKKGKFYIKNPTYKTIN